MGLTVNQLRELRRFESFTAHPYWHTARVLLSGVAVLSVCVVGPRGAGVAHILGKNEVMGSNPITGSSGFLTMHGTIYQSLLGAFPQKST